MTTSHTHSRVAGLQVTDHLASAVLISADSGELVRVPIAVEPVLTLDPSGDSFLGAPTSPTADTVAGFADRVGDSAGVDSAHGVPLRAEDLVATALFLLLREFADSDGSLPTAAAVYPESWSPEQVDILREAMNFTGLTGVSLLADTAELRAAGHGAERGLDAVLGAARTRTTSPAVAPYAEPITEAFEPAPATGLTTAYAQAVVPAAALPSSVDEPAPRRPPGAKRRTALLVGAVVVAGLLLTAGIVGVVTQATTSETPIPPIDNASGATSSVESGPAAAPAAPVTFPTVAPGAATVVPQPAPVAPAPAVETAPPVITPPAEPPVEPTLPEITEPPVTEVPVETTVETDPEITVPTFPRFTVPRVPTLPRPAPFG